MERSRRSRAVDLETQGFLDHFRLGCANADDSHENALQGKTHLEVLLGAPIRIIEDGEPEKKGRKRLLQ